MIGLASILGFVIGVAIGALAAASTGSELREGAQNWVSYRQWEVYARRDTWKFPTLLEVILNLSRVELLFLLVCAWIIGLLCLVLLEPMWSQGPSALSYFVGSLVGAAAAPWIWLHFTHTFGKGRVAAEPDQAGKEAGKQGDDDTKKKEGKDAKGSGEADQFARYQFVTYMLGAALLVTVLLPQLSKLLPRTSSFGALGVSVAFVNRGDAPRNDLGTTITSVGALPSGPSTENTARRLSTATTAAHHVASGKRPKDKHEGERKKLADVKSGLKGFSDLSMMDRDKVYIAYLLHEQAVRQNTSRPPPQFEDLQQYVGKLEFKHGPDTKYLDSLAVLSECVARYAEEIRDFRLFFVDSNNFLRALMVGVASQWGPSPSPTDSAGDDAKKKKRDTRKLIDFNLDRFPRQIVDALVYVHDGDPSKPCANAADLTAKVEPATWPGVGATPYPAYQIAHYLAAIDSVESGVLVLQDWLAYQKDQLKNQARTRDPEQAWYTVRAMLAASQLPYRFGSVSPTHASLVQFQHVTTDRIGELLGLRGARTWRALCSKLARQGLHAQIGRYLAWTYADERNYLFELLLPEDFGLPRDKSLKTVNVAPTEFLEEAEAMIETAPDCFAGVFQKPEAYQKIVALFHLNAAQLRYAVRAATKSSEEKAALTKKIVIDLERARPLETKDELPAADLDLIRPADEFDRHRARLARLLKVLDNEAERD
ncbi:MAG TPA: hypothetical protein VFB68_11945 [Xanthobacteraceae bacterium]|nr:hypothetical protein [Xanthobacteraceae bacterium]